MAQDLNLNQRLIVTDTDGVRVTGITSGTYLEISGNLPGYTNGQYPVLKSGGTIHFGVNGVYRAYLEGNDTYFGILNNSSVTTVLLKTSGSSYLNGGNVGIGTTSPTAKLTIGVNTSVQSTNGIALGVGETSLEFVHSAYQNGFGSKLYSVDSGNGITSLRIATRPNSTSWSDAVTIIAGASGNGNVGIGTTSPSYKLHVNGSGYFENQLTVSDSLTAEALYQRNSNYSNVRITGLNASGTQERRWTIARLYFTPNHWGSHSMIKIRLVSEYYNAGYVEYNLHTYYGMGNGNSALYYVTDKGGYTGAGGADGMKISLGSVTLAGWTSGSQNTYYQDVYVDVNDYMQATAHIECLGIDYATSNPTSSADGYNVFVVYTSPSVANFTWDDFDHSSSYFGSAKIWNSSNDGASSGLDADLLDGNHASAFALASHTHSEYYPTTGGTLTGDIIITKTSPWIFLNKQGNAVTDQESGISWQYKGNAIFYFYSDNGDDGNLRIQAPGLTGESDAAPRLIIPRSNKDLYLAVSGGNVGIGTTSPSDILHVYKSGANTRLIVGNNAAYDQFIYFQGNTDWSMGIDASNTNAFTLGNYSSIGTNVRLTVTTGGNVGIGTTSPSSKLHSKGEIRVDFNDTDGSTYITGYGVEFERGSNYLRPRGADGTQTLYVGGANDSLDWSRVNFKVSSEFSVKSGGTDAFIINSSGNVGIGTTSPDAPLEVYRSQARTSMTGTAFGTLHIDGGETSSYISSITLAQYNNVPISIIGTKTDTSFGTTMFFGTSNSYVSGVTNTAMVINYSGNVGIGTTSPTLGLHVENGKGLLVGGAGYTGSTYVSPSDANTINGGYGIAEDTGDIWLNYRGYQDGFSYFRDTRIGNGKGTAIVMVDGSAGNVGIGTTSPGKKLDVAGQIRQIGGGDYWYVSSAATFTSSSREVTLSRSSAGYVVATPYGAVKKFNASVAFKTSNSTHLGITFLAADESPEDNNYAVILRSVNTVRVQKRVSGTQTYPINEISLTGTDIDDGNWHTISVSFDGAYISVDVDGTNYINQTWTDTSFTSGMVGPTIYDGSVEFNDFSCSEINSKNVNTSLHVSSRLGIGTTSPSQKLQVGAPTDTVAYARWVSTTADLYVGANSTGTHIGVTNGAKILQTGSYPLVIGTTTNQELYLGANNAIIATLVDGKMGIGTTSPGATYSEKLQISNGTLSRLNLTHTAATGQRQSDILFTENTTLQGQIGVIIGFSGYDDQMWVRGTADIPLTFLTNSIERMRITSAGNVGVGTDGPAAKLHVVGAQQTASAKAPGVIIQQQYYDPGSGGQLTSSALTLRTTSSGGDNWASGAIVGLVGNPADTSNYPGGLAFYTKPKGTVSTDVVEAMRIAYNSNVLIGTTTDNGDKLQVAGTTTISGNLYLRGGTRYIVGDGGDLYIDTENVAGRDILLQTQSGQNVGIGTTSPGYKLDVSGGAIAIRGNTAGNSLRFDDSLGTSRNAMYVDTSNYLNIGNPNYAGVKFVQTASAPTTGEFAGNQIQNAMGDTSNGVVLAEPDAWLAVRVGTIDYAIPMYLA